MLIGPPAGRICSSKACGAVCVRIADVAGRARTSSIEVGHWPTSRFPQESDADAFSKLALTKDMWPWMQAFISSEILVLTLQSA